MVAALGEQVMNESIAVDIADRSFLADPIKRVKVLKHILMLSRLFQGYIHVVMFALHPAYKGEIPYETIENLFAPFSIIFKLMHLIEKALPTEDEIERMKTGTILKFEKTAENTLYSYILYDLVSTVYDISIIQCSASALPHHNELLKDPKNEYIDVKHSFKALEIVAKGLSLSELNGVFEFFNSTKSEWSGFNVWYNFSRSIDKLILAYGYFDEVDLYGDFMLRVFISKDIMTALSKVMRVYSINLADPKITDDPQTMAEVTTAVLNFAVGTSKLCLDLPETKFTLPAVRATLECLAFGHIQKEVCETSIRMYTVATNSRNLNFSPEVRMQLCWAAMNLLSLYGTAYILFHGRDSYMSSTNLNMTSYIAKCWCAILHYFTTLPKDEQEKWRTVQLTFLPTWPAVFIKAMRLQSGQDSELDGNDQLKDVLDPNPVNATLFEIEMDLKCVLNTLKNASDMAASVTFFLKTVDNVGMVNDITMTSTIANILLSRLMHCIKFHLDKRQEIYLLLPETLTMALAGMKMMKEWVLMPTSALTNAISQIPGAMLPVSIEENKIRLACTALKAFNVVDIITTGKQGYYACPPSCEKIYTALSLVVIDVLQSIPESVHVNTLLDEIFKISICRLRVSEILSSVVLPIEQGVIKKLHGLAQDDFRAVELNSRIDDDDAEDEDRKRQLEAARIRFLHGKMQNLQSLKELINEAKNASVMDAERAVKRSEVLAVLPCSYLGCNAIPVPGQDNISNKRCSGCKVVRYCSAKCQKKDWKMHKNACKAMTAPAGGR
jgi:MYND finger